MYYRISKNEKNLFFGKKIAQVWAVTLRPGTSKAVLAILRPLEEVNRQIKCGFEHNL